MVVDHLSLLELDQEGSNNEEPIKEIFSDEMILTIKSKDAPWFVDIANFLLSGEFPEEFTKE